MTLIGPFRPFRPGRSGGDRLPDAAGPGVRPHVIRGKPVRYRPSADKRPKTKTRRRRTYREVMADGAVSGLMAYIEWLTEDPLRRLHWALPVWMAVLGPLFAVLPIGAPWVWAGAVAGLLAALVVPTPDLRDVRLVTHWRAGWRPVVPREAYWWVGGVAAVEAWCLLWFGHRLTFWSGSTWRWYWLTSLVLVVVWHRWGPPRMNGKPGKWEIKAESWAKLCERHKIAPSDLVSQTKDLTDGTVTWVIRITESGKTAKSLIASDKMRDWCAAYWGCPAARVTVIGDPKHAGRVIVTQLTRDPYAQVIRHPVYAAIESKDAAALIAPTRITGPIVIGIDKLHRRPMVLHLAKASGGQHTAIVAPTRKGKTNLINVILEFLTRCDHVEVDIVDFGKGKDARAWGPLCRKVATDPLKPEEGLEILTEAAALIQSRAKVNLDAVWKPTRQHPARVVIVDEASALLAQGSHAVRATDLVSSILQRGGSEMVILIVASQRAVKEHFGTGDVKANCANKIVLPVGKDSEQSFMLGEDWTAAGLPPMRTFGDGRDGMALVVPARYDEWVAGRCFALYDLANIRALVAFRLEVRLGMRERPATPQDDAEDVEVEVSVDDMPQRSRWRRGGPLALPWRRGEATTPADADGPLSEPAAAALAHLRTVFPAGVRRGDLEAVMGLARSQARAHLAALIDRELAVSRGNGPALRYYAL